MSAPTVPRRAAAGVALSCQAIPTCGSPTARPIWSAPRRSARLPGPASVPGRRAGTRRAVGSVGRRDLRAGLDRRVTSVRADVRAKRRRGLVRSAKVQLPTHFSREDVGRCTSGSAKPGTSSSVSALIGTCASSWHRIAATDAITRIGMTSLGGRSICRAVLICATDRSI